MKYKGNDGSGNNIERDDWETPQWLIKELSKQYGLVFDCCAILKNCKFSIHSNDFLREKGINYPAWMNPPFSKAQEMFDHFFKVVRKGIAIYRCDNMETEIWQKVIFPNASWIFVFDKRINYEYDNNKRGITGARFPSALIGIGVEPPKELNGKLLKTK